MKINQEYLDKKIYWIKLRCSDNAKTHSDNVLAFVKEKGKSIHGELQVEVAFNSFKKLNELDDELCNIEPNISLRSLHTSLAIAIINEDYIKAEKYKNKIIEFNP